MGCSTSMMQVITPPDLTNIGAFFERLPVFLSMEEVSCRMLHSSATAWTCRTAVYPAEKIDLCSRSSTMMSCASNLLTAGQPRLPRGVRTKPGMMSSSEMSLSLTRAFSPPTRYWTSSWSSQSWSTSTGVLLGIMQSLSPTVMVPCSTLPSMIVPRSLYFESVGNRSGASLLRSITGSSSSTSRKQGPVYHGAVPSGRRLMTLAAVSAEMGRKMTSFLGL
mmetsp:Transcript_38940/g.82989  ORF Transcript_38940/g.82989 Transcript_38940/m.82989 type:complete len:220 (-) Transcript_38940:641-1300(-)